MKTISTAANLFASKINCKDIKIFRYYKETRTRWRSWLRHCATSQNVAGLIPDGVIGNFHWHNPSGRNMALGSTQLKKK